MTTDILKPRVRMLHCGKCQECDNHPKRIKHQNKKTSLQTHTHTLTHTHTHSERKIRKILRNNNKYYKRMEARMF